MHVLTTGLSDQSKELGETTVVSTPIRIRTYNDAVVDFANERKWPFLVKENAAKSTIVGVNTIDISDITDMRWPGPIKEILLGSETEAYLPINWEDRNDIRYSSGKYFYISPDEATLTLKGDLMTEILVVHIWYYYIPVRIEDTTSATTFPIPDRYRKAVAILGAAYVQWSRYLDVQGNRLFNIYEKMIGKITDQQSERSDRNPKRLQHYLQFIGFRRTYPK